MNYRPEIDGLRALAVAAVIINHLNKDWLPGGHLGVDIFFVISGYVITASLHANQSCRIGDYLSGFYLGRLKRLMPALILCVTVTSVSICLFNPTPNTSLMTGVAALVGLSNFYLYSEATDYFGGSARLNAFTQTWSLGVEEQFYFFFPLLVWALGFTRLSIRRKGMFLAAVGGLTLSSLCAFLVLSGYRSATDFAFYMMPTRVWELGAGALVFAASDRLRSLPRYSALTALVAMLAVLCWSPPSSWGNLAITLLTATVLSGLGPSSPGYSVATMPPVLLIGRISYSLYLWHWSVLVLSQWTVGFSPFLVPLKLALMLALAAGSYFFVEKPVRSMIWPRNFARSFGIAYALLTGSVCLLVPLHWKIYAGQQAKLSAVGVRSLTDPYTLGGDLGTWHGIDCVLSDNAQAGKKISIDSCTLGNFDHAETRILVVGNSFSTAFVRSFDKGVASKKFAVTVTSCWGASPISSVPNNGKWAVVNDDYWTRVVPSMTTRLRKGDWVFMVSDLAEFLPTQESDASRARLALLANGLDAFSRQLSSQGVRLAILHGLPFARDASCEPQRGLPQWFTLSDGPCQFYSRVSTLARREPLSQMLAKLADRRILVVIDLFEIFCPGKNCTYLSNDGQLLYRDEWSHPSVEAARLAAPIFYSHFGLASTSGHQ